MNDPIEKTPSPEVLSSGMASREVQSCENEEPRPASDIPDDAVSDLEVDEAGAAHYEVSVCRYAHYDKASGSDYDDAMQKRLKYASRTPMSRFFLDFVTILTRPRAFWKGQSEHPASLGHLHGPHLTLLVLIRAISVVVGGVLQAGTDLSQVVIQAVSQAILIYVSVWVLALLISGILSLAGQGFHYDRAVRFVGYSITPMLFVSIISMIPVPWMGTVCDLLAMPWAFIAMGAGMLSYLKVAPEKAPTLTGLFCGLMMCVWGLMPMLVPLLIGFHVNG